MDVEEVWQDMNPYLFLVIFTVLTWMMLRLYYFNNWVYGIINTQTHQVIKSKLYFDILKYIYVYYSSNNLVMHFWT